MAFPEGGKQVDAGDADVTKLSLHTPELRWSLGGLKGRPQTDWPYLLVQKPPSQVVDTIAKMGFTAIVVDRWATEDRGKALEAAYAPYTGAPTFVSPDGRWAYLSVQRQLAEVNAATTPGERAAFTARILAGGS
jgi:phosphoglycerol transferase